MVFVNVQRKEGHCCAHLWRRSRPYGSSRPVAMRNAFRSRLHPANQGRNDGNGDARSRSRRRRPGGLSPARYSPPSSPRAAWRSCPPSRAPSSLRSRAIIAVVAGENTPIGFQQESLQLTAYHRLREFVDADVDQHTHTCERKSE